MILALIKAVQGLQTDGKLASDQASLDKVQELLRSSVIELISAIRSTNYKIRASAEESFQKMAQILSAMKQLPQLFQMMLVGLAGQTPQIQSCAIRALIFNFKQSIMTE